VHCVNGDTGAHGHSGLLGQGPTRWPKLAAFGSPCQQSAARARPERALCASSAHRRTVTAAGLQTWHDAQWRSRASLVTRSSVKPPPLLRLHAATPRPRQGGRKRCAQWRGGRVAAIDDVEGGNGSQVGEGAPSLAS
jgi:hypothetical protein